LHGVYRVQGDTTPKTGNPVRILYLIRSLTEIFKSPAPSIPVHFVIE